ncbi:MAG TPA: shikimate kinase [Pyrinomonadaceae bacterium]|nr:shikimate kinase [Pyrinomonadaceae bacterium]
MTRVVVTGFMAAGKTTVGRALARLLGCAFEDLDEVVTAREGRTPQQLIDEAGEAAFREAETRALRAALGGGERKVVALGGGAWTLERNRELVRARGFVSAWLDAPFELCRERILDGGPDRPFARDLERARRLYDERRAAYSLADLRVGVTRASGADELAAELAARLNEERGR